MVYNYMFCKYSIIDFWSELNDHRVVEELIDLINAMYLDLTDENFFCHPFLSLWWAFDLMD